MVQRELCDRVALAPTRCPRAIRALSNTTAGESVADLITTTGHSDGP